MGGFSTRIYKRPSLHSSNLKSDRSLDCVILYKSINNVHKSYPGWRADSSPGPKNLRGKTIAGMMKYTIIKISCHACVQVHINMSISAGPLLHDWYILAQYGNSGPLLTYVCTAGPLLTDVLLVIFWLMYCWSSAAWCTYCWSSAACWPASLLLTDAMCIILI